MPGHKTTTGKALTAVKQMKVSDNDNDSGEDDDSSDVILAFINSEKGDANERPNATRSGRAITRRSE